MGELIRCKASMSSVLGFPGISVLSGKWLGDRPLNKSASLHKIILLFFKKVLYFYAEKY